MRVLYVLNGSNFTSAGGMEYHLIDIVGWMRRKGVETACAVRKGTYLQTHLLGGQANVFPLHWTGLMKLFGFVQAARAIWVFAPDIISINRERDISRIYWITRVLRPFLRKRPKIIAVFQNVNIRFGASFDLCRLDRLVFINKFTKDEFIAGNPAAEARSVIIHYGIALPETDPETKLDPKRPRRILPDAPFPIIGMVGNFRKNQTELIDVAYRLRQRLREFTIAFVGGGTPDQILPLKEKIDRLGLNGHFLFTGDVKRERIPDVFYDLDISVSTNRSEAFGIVFIESLAAYTPLVAYDSGGPVEILRHGGGVLVQGQADAMADALYRLVTDDALRRSVALAARDAAERFFSMDAMGERYYRLYVKLSNGSLRPEEAPEP